MPVTEVNGVTIHYETAGEGFPLVLLHGIGGNARSWRRQLVALSADFKVIAWDAPGAGQSSDPIGKPSMLFYADCLHGLLDALNLPETFLLGHSTGGVIAQEFYLAYGAYVRKLIIADTRTGGNKSLLEQRLRMIRTQNPAQMAAERSPRLLSAAAPAALIQEVASIMCEVHPAGYEFAAIAMSEADTREVLRNLRVPTLLIWGDSDQITPLWEEVPPGAKLEIIEHAGHLCYVEQPEKFNSIVRKFLLE